MNKPLFQRPIGISLFAFLFAILIPAYTGAITPPAQTWETTIDGPVNYGAGNWPANALAVDPADDSFVAAYHTTVGTKQCITLQKYNSSHAILWTRTHFGGAGCTLEAPRAVAIDTNGDIVVVGYSETVMSSFDWVVLKYDSAGNFLCSTTFSNSGATDDQAYCVAIDPTDHAIVVGGTQNQFPMKIIRYNSTLSTQVWQKSPGYMITYAVGIAPNRDVLVAGAEAGSDYNWRIIRYKLDGTLLNNFAVTGGHKICHSIAIDPVTGDYYLGGRGGVASNVDWLVRKYNSADTMVWSSTWTSPGVNGDDIWNLALNSCHRLIGVGYRMEGGTDVSWAANEFCTDTGKIIWTRTLTSYPSVNAEAWGIAFNSAGKTLVSGYDSFAGTIKWAIREYAAETGPCSCPTAATLTTTLTGTPATCLPGEWVTLKLKVMNTGSSSASGVSPSLSPILGASNVTLISGPIPAGPVSLAYLASQEFTWTYSVSGNGTMKFAGGAAGTDSTSALPVSATSNTVTITANGTASLNCSLTASPGTVLRGETADIIVAVANTGAVASNSVMASINVTSGTGLVLALSGPIPAAPVTLGAGASQNFTWTYSATGSGTAVFSGGASGVDSVSSSTIICSGSTDSLTITEPPAPVALSCNLVMVPAQGVIGQPLTISAVLHNIGSNGLTGVAPNLKIIMGSKLISPDTTIITPSAIASGASHTWSWTFTALKGGPVSFSITASGTDGADTAATSCSVSGDINLAVEAGTVKIVGGIRGYINPKKGEQSNILIRANEPGEIVVRIYDMAGRLVREMKSVTSGNRTESVKWDGKDSGGKDVTPGGYPIIITGPGGLTYRDKLAVLR